MKKRYYEMTIHEKINLKSNINYRGFNIFIILNKNKIHWYKSFSVPKYANQRTIIKPNHQAIKIRTCNMLQRSNFLKVCYQLRDKELLKHRNKLNL